MNPDYKVDWDKFECGVGETKVENAEWLAEPSEEIAINAGIGAVSPYSQKKISTTGKKYYHCPLPPMDAYAQLKVS
jgi:hypothetical protein